MTGLRDLPSVDQILQTEPSARWVAEYGRPLAVEAVRSVLDRARRAYPTSHTLPSSGELFEAVEQTLVQWTAATLQPVINATGVVLHTNLGRAPLSGAAIRAAMDAGQCYSTLEFDLSSGRRGSRLIHAEALLTRFTGAQAAMVVNNNAAAVLLALTALARRRGVVIARSQLVEIGGGFRVPEVMKQSGARLIEVGATNRVHLEDYRTALEQKPALFLRVHRSNFRIIGFTAEPGLGEIARIAHDAGLPLVDDLGSGALLDTERYGLTHEPTVQESLAAGADLVCFSGDKLLGGPQAGIIVGRADLIATIKKHPLARAVRADKLCLAALSATLLHYTRDEAEAMIPTWRMIAASVESLHRRALAWTQELRCGEVVTGLSTVGGGSLPGETLPTALLVLAVAGLDRRMTALRRQTPPIIARLEAGRLVFDPRTVLPEQDITLLNGIRLALEEK